MIDFIIASKLIDVDISLNYPVEYSSDVHTQFVWSANAPEQIGEFINRELK